MDFDAWSGPGGLIDSLIRQRAHDLPDKPFAVFADSTITFGALDSQATELAWGLHSYGLKAGAAVAVYLPNRPELLVSMFGIQRAGGVYVPCSIILSADELAYQINHTQAEIVIVDASTLPALTTVLDGCPQVREVFVAGTERLHGRPSWTELRAVGAGAGGLPYCRPDDLALVMYTSGTTARPKGVEFSHANLAVIASNLTAAFEWSRHDRFLHFFPLYHANGGLVSLLPAIATGATIVFLERFSASRFSQQLVEHQITLCSINSTHCRYLLATPEHQSDDRHDTWRMTLGLTLSPAEVEAFERRFRTRLCPTYGLTEGNCITIAVPPSEPRRPGCSGRVLRGYKAKVLDEQGADLAAGEEGELCITSVQRHGLPRGYHHDPDLEHAAFGDGWLHTGDRGYLDKDGYFWFTGRSKDLIKRSGYNVSPAEIERVIGALPGVHEVAVVSCPDDVLDEAIVAFVVVQANASLTSELVTSECEHRLSPYKVPQHVAVIDTLPVSVIGKVDRQQLRERAAEIHSTDIAAQPRQR